MGILAQWRIGARLAVGYALMIVLMVVALAATWFNLDRIRQANDTLQHVQSERLALAREWHENIVANSTRAMAMALDETGMVDQYFAEAARAVTDRTTVIQRRYAEIETTETGRRIAQQLGEVRQRYLSRREALLQSGTSEGLQARAAAFQSVVKDYVATADAMVAYQIQRQTELGQAVDHRVEQAEWIFVLLTAFKEGRCLF